MVDRMIWKTGILLALCLPLLFAAEKNRDWKNGQILEPKPPYDSRIHGIGGVDKNYIVRGSFGEAEDTLVAGTPVRYAIEGTTMYVSLNGHEYKLAVIGATVKPSMPAPAAAPAIVPVNPVVVAPVTQPDGKAGLVAVEATLDNDAVVKMVVGGLKEDTVISVIQARPGKYAVNPDAIAALKAAGVPQRVIDAMQAKAASQH